MKAINLQLRMLFCTVYRVTLIYTTGSILWHLTPKSYLHLHHLWRYFELLPPLGAVPPTHHKTKHSLSKPELLELPFSVTSDWQSYLLLKI